MTDTPTPTDQPSELDAIRARVEEIVKSLDGINHNPKYFNDYVSKYQGAVRALAGFSRRLLELLDERDAIIEHEQFISASLEATYDTMKARNVKHSSEIESLRRELAEAREKAIEEAALVAENFPESKSEGCAEAIRSLKQPN